MILFTTARSRVSEIGDKLPSFMSVTSRELDGSSPEDLSYIRAMMRQEEARSEKLVNVVRVGLALLILVIALAIREEIPQLSFFAILGCVTISLVYGGVLWAIVKWHGYRPFIKYVSTTFDIVLLSVAMVSFGGYRTFKAEASLLYFLWITLAVFRFSVLLTLYAGFLSCLSFVVMIVGSLVFGTIELGSITESYRSSVVSLGNLGIRLTFLVAFSFFALYIARLAQEIVVRTAVHQLTAARERHARERVRQTLSQYVAPQVAEKILMEGSAGRTERIRATILFCDLRDFTRTSEGMDPEDVVVMLNEYFNRLIEIVNAYNGTWSKFTGDGFMALFGVPAASGHDEEMAVRSAIQMRDAFQQINQSRQREGKVIVNFGIGIHTGDVIAGDVGSSVRKEYTVIGSPVNIASRVESLNKTLGTDILISQETYDQVKDLVDVKRQPRMSIKGLQSMIQTYQIKALHQPIDPETVHRQAFPEFTASSESSSIGFLVRVIEQLFKRLQEK